MLKNLFKFEFNSYWRNIDKNILLGFFILFFLGIFFSFSSMSTHESLSMDFMPFRLNLPSESPVCPSTILNPPVKSKIPFCLIINSSVDLDSSEYSLMSSFSFNAAIFEYPIMFCIDSSE